MKKIVFQIVLLIVLLIVTFTLRGVQSNSTNAAAEKIKIHSSAGEAVDDASVFDDLRASDLAFGAETEITKITWHRIGKLSLPDGRIMACDAIMFDGAAFDRAVAPGDYDVFVAIASFDSGDERIAFSRVQFANDKATTWKAAGRYGVDSGTGCFASASASENLQTAMDEGLVFERAWAEAQTVYKHTRDWAQIDTDSGNCIWFSSGFGDGVYESYFGYGSEGNIVALVTDFGLVQWR